MDDLNMMGDMDKDEEDLVNNESFMIHRGSGEDPFFNDLDLSDLEDDSVSDIEWSQSDLGAIINELELLENYIQEEEEQQAEDEHEGSDGESDCDEGEQWESPAEELIRSLKPFESFKNNDEEKAGGECQSSEGTEGDFIKGQKFSSDEWYEYPYGSDFIRDFYCLQNGGLELRDDLLDMLRFTDNTENDWNGENYTTKGPVHDEITVAINDILVPELSREGLKKLLKILLRRPTVNLKIYLENADPFLLAYIIWGLNFYLGHFAKELSQRYARPHVKTQEMSVQTSKQESLPGKIFSVCVKMLTWLCDGIHKSRWNPIYEGILQNAVNFNASELL